MTWISKKFVKYGSNNKSTASTVFCDLDGILVWHVYSDFKYDPQRILKGSFEKLLEMRKVGTYIVLTTARSKSDCKYILRYFKKHGFKFDKCLFDLPVGKRVVINDTKYKGQVKAVAVEYPRNYGIRDFTNF